ncbi:MAG: M48 family metallopeptidase [Clostridia bacterium]|nr:M48 family metallopeptidase [Clostridia bacterium]
MNLVKVKNVIKTIERHPVEILGNDYRVKIEYRNIKVMELNVYEDTIKIILQNKYKNVNNERMLDYAINKMYKAIAKVEIERAMEKTRLLVGFAPEDYVIKSIGELAKCENSIITINPQIVKYSRDVIDYVVLKQYLHLKYKTECQGYKKLLKKYCKNYENFEKVLKF